MVNFFTAADSSVPPSALDILCRTFLIYFLNIIPILSISAVFIPPVLIIIYCGWRYVHSDEGEHTRHYVSFAVATLCARILLRVLLPVAMCKVAVNAHARRRSTCRDVLGTSPAHAGWVALASWLGASLASIGHVFFVWPGVYLRVGWVLATPAIVVEDRGTIGGMSRSWDLTSGQRIGLMVTWLCFWIATSGLVAFAIILFLTCLSWDTDDLQVSTIIVQTSANLRSASMFAAVLLVAVVLPLENIFATVLYFDVRAQKESYSAAMLCSRLDSRELAAPLIMDLTPSTAKETSEVAPDRAGRDPSTPAWTNTAWSRPGGTGEAQCSDIC